MVENVSLESLYFFLPTYRCAKHEKNSTVTHTPVSVTQSNFSDLWDTARHLLTSTHYKTEFEAHAETTNYNVRLYVNNTVLNFV